MPSTDDLQKRLEAMERQPPRSSGLVTPDGHPVRPPVEKTRFKVGIHPAGGVVWLFDAPTSQLAFTPREALSLALTMRQQADLASVGGQAHRLTANSERPGPLVHEGYVLRFAAQHQKATCYILEGTDPRKATDTSKAVAHVVDCWSWSEALRRAVQVVAALNGHSIQPPTL